MSDFRKDISSPSSSTLTILFFREVKSPLRTARMLEPIFIYAQSAGTKIEILGQVRERDLESELRRLLERYEVQYTEFPYPIRLESSTTGRATWQRVFNYIRYLRRSAKFLTNRISQSSAVLSVSNSLETRQACTIAAKLKKPFIMLQWAPTMLAPDQRAREEKISIKKNGIKATLLKWLPTPFGAFTSQNLMDMPGATCVFWNEHQKKLFEADTKRPIKAAAFSVPHLDSITRLGIEISPKPHSALYVMGYPPDFYDPDNSIYTRFVPLEEHLREVRKIFDLLKERYGYVHWAVKLRPMLNGYSYFEEKRKIFEDILGNCEIFTDQNSLELMAKSDFVWSDYFSSSVIEAHYMGRSTFHFDFELEISSLRSVAFDQLGKLGITNLNANDLCTLEKLPDRNLTHCDQQNTAKLFQYIFENSKSSNLDQRTS